MQIDIPSFDFSDDSARMSRRRQCSTGHALPSRSQKQLHNTLPTGAILTVLILTFGPCRGAHFNPAVSVAFALRRQISWQIAGCYVGDGLDGIVIAAPSGAAN
jgi:glycerol uptake facilitator-like aquaporin